MQKNTKKNKVPKQRNPFVEHIRMKSSGAHGKTKKAIRRNEKVAMQKGDYSFI